ncbi:ABC transporter F family member 4-like [Micropterus dolomieu]|uniref:ABC transporter F family member 4-like n=1 Tax=Micropterus dolomieu TaxID=147949 RepID=UPI001E8DA336|nr:ABC transporter F family member 4-like [Micropterus dolomieu]
MRPKDITQYQQGWQREIEQSLTLPAPNSTLLQILFQFQREQKSTLNTDKDPQKSTNEKNSSTDLTSKRSECAKELPLPYLHPWPMPSPPRNTPLMLGLVLTKSRAFQQMLTSMKYWASRWAAFHQADHAVFFWSASSGASTSTSREMHLQQRWQELRERELTAQQHNRQLLQQFEEAQDTLREMLSLTAAMKTIRMEYERYLDESSPRWQKELKEKTQAAQKKRMEEYLRSCLKNTEDKLTKSSADRPLLSQGPTSKPQNVAPPQKHCSQNSHLDYNQHGSPHLPYTQSSWQTNPQSQASRFPIRAPHQLQGSSHVPPSFLPPTIFPDPFQLHHLGSTPGHHHPWPRQNPPVWSSSQPHYPWTAGAAGIPSGSEALWGQLYTEEPPTETGVAQTAEEEAETSRAPSSKRERGGGSRSSHLSQELDIKPVRLSSGHAESGESSMECSQASTEKRKRREKRGIARRTSSDRERRSSQESSRISSAVVTAAVTVAQSSESEASSEKGRTSTRRTRRSGGLSVGSPGDEKETKGRTRSNGDDSGSHKEETQSGEELGSPTEESRGGKAGDQSSDVKSERCNEESGSQREEEESGSVSLEIENEGGDEIEKQERSSVGDEDEEEREKDLGDGEGDDSEEKQNNQTDHEQEERDVEDDDEASEKKNTTEEEEETGAEEEMEESERLKSDGGEKGKQGPASSQDEEVGEDASEGGEEKTEEAGESYEEEEGEQRRDEAGEPEEGGDSEDSIISPQDKSKMMHIIPEAASEDEEDDEEEGSKTGSSDGDSNEISDEDDVEHLLAPQQQSQKKEAKDLRAHEKPKAFCDKVEIFQVELDKSTKTDNPSDSDEFDHFYD